MASLSVILVNYNRYQDTLACISSLQASSLRDIEVIVVDNASTDGSAAQIRKAHPGLRLLSNTENLGFAGGNNAGIRRALDSGSRYVLLLNNDTVVDKSAFEMLVRTLEEHPDAGIVG